MNNPSWDITLQSIIWVWSCGSVVRFSLSWLLMIHFWLENILDIILFPTYTAMSSTAKILAAITLAIPTGETHMIASTILMITWRNCDARDDVISGQSSTWSIVPKMVTSCFPELPKEPRTVPKARQKNITPRVFVPGLNKSSSLTSVAHSFYL